MQMRKVHSQTIQTNVIVHGVHQYGPDNPLSLTVQKHEQSRPPQKQLNRCSTEAETTRKKPSKAKKYSYMQTSQHLFFA